MEYCTGNNLVSVKVVDVKRGNLGYVIFVSYELEMSSKFHIKYQTDLWRFEGLLKSLKQSDCVSPFDIIGSV